MIVFVRGIRSFPDFVQVFSTGDGDDFKTYAYAMLHMKVKGITIAHADEDELNELLQQINISVVHRVELKAAIASWRGDAWQSMHSLEKGRLRHQAAAAHDAEYMEKSVEFKQWCFEQLRSMIPHYWYDNVEKYVDKLMSLFTALDVNKKNFPCMPFDEVFTQSLGRSIPQNVSASSPS